ncbi:hypothetical protein K440DRAFT_47244 [Wilcoxina mikolae CBS 423.85]|nr:hypothetical protein K440DRAFT_47244 [Wilcoxina mikolae CBS 423.85]
MLTVTLNNELLWIPFTPSSSSSSTLTPLPLPIPCVSTPIKPQRSPPPETPTVQLDQPIIQCLGEDGAAQRGGRGREEGMRDEHLEGGGVRVWRRGNLGTCGRWVVCIAYPTRTALPLLLHSCFAYREP